MPKRIKWIIIILAALGFAGWYLYKTLAPVAATTATIEAGTLVRVDRVEGVKAFVTPVRETAHI